MSKTIQSSDQIHTLHHTLYTPDIEPKATLLLLHGMCEHRGRYDKFAKYLAGQGIVVLTYDQLGHGQSIRNADDLGYFTQSYPVQTVLRDVITMANILKGQYPDLPHFIMGHSMGSFIVRNVIQLHSSEFRGAILMGSSDYNPLIKLVLPLSNMLNKLQPRRSNSVFSSVMNKLFNSQLKSKNIDSEYAWLCANPDAIKAYEEDPLCGFDFTNNGFWTLFNLMDKGVNKKWAESIDHDFPMYFVSGENDPVGDMGKGIRKLVKRLKKQGYTHVEHQLYPLMRHEPLHEIDNEQVYQDIEQWLSMHTEQ